MVRMLSGVLPIISLASSPTARTLRTPFIDLHRDDRGLAGDDALAADIDDRVGGAEVDGEVARREVEQ